MPIECGNSDVQLSYIYTLGFSDAANRMRKLFNSDVVTNSDLLYTLQLLDTPTSRA